MYIVYTFFKTCCHLLSAMRCQNESADVVWKASMIETSVEKVIYMRMATGSIGNQCKNMGTCCNNLLKKRRKKMKEERTIYKMMTKMRIERIS